MKRFIILFLLIVSMLTGTTVYYLNSEANSPDAAIKKYVLKNGNPLEASDLIIRPTATVDKTYGKLFIVEGFIDNVTRMQPRFFYLKKNKTGWYVESAGTGP